MPLREYVTGSSRAGFFTFSCAVDPFDRLVEAMDASQNSICVCIYIYMPYPWHMEVPGPGFES